MYKSKYMQCNPNYLYVFHLEALKSDLVEE